MVRIILSIFIFLLLLPSCKSKCENGIQDPGEEGIDCGGKCWSCYVDPDPSVCDETPDLFGQLYCAYPDTNGFSVQPPPDTTRGPQFFMFTLISSAEFLTLCNGTFFNESYNSFEPNTYYQISRFSMIEDIQNGGYDYTFIESTYWEKNSKCHFIIPTVFGQPCAWFSDGTSQVRYVFEDHQDSIYVFVQAMHTVTPENLDTLVYYPINP